MSAALTIACATFARQDAELAIDVHEVWIARMDGAALSRVQERLLLRPT
jgi:hypothetical protein